MGHGNSGSIAGPAESSPETGRREGPDLESNRSTSRSRKGAEGEHGGRACSDGLQAGAGHGEGGLHDGNRIPAPQGAKAWSDRQRLPLSWSR